MIEGICSVRMHKVISYKETVVAVPLFLNDSFCNTFAILIRMSGHSRKRSTLGVRPLCYSAGSHKLPYELVFITS